MSATELGLYQPTAEQVQTFRQRSRRIERMMARKGGSFVDPSFAIAKLDEVIVMAESFKSFEEFTIRVPALPRPTLAELQRTFPWEKIEKIERDSSPTRAITLQLTSILSDGERYAGGSEYERRIASKLSLILGYQQAAWLVEHQDEHQAFRALLQRMYIDFTGLVVIRAIDGQGFPYLIKDGTRFDIRWHSFGNGFHRRGRLAVSGNPTHTV